LEVSIEYQLLRRTEAHIYVMKNCLYNRFPCVISCCILPQGH
jgi:hypothetical protein